MTQGTTLPMVLKDKESVTAAGTIQHAIDRISTSASIEDRRRRELISALRTLCRALRAQPIDVPILPAALRVRMDKVSPEAVGLTMSRWTNVRSLTGAALRECGLDIMPGKRADASFSPAWEKLWSALLADRRLRYGLSRFISYCCANDIMPEDVSTDTFSAFNYDLQVRSLVRNIPDVYRSAAVCWNDASQVIDGWPTVRVNVPSRRQRYSLHWDEFPASLIDDVEAFLERGTNPDIFADDYSRPLSPATIKSRRKQILLLSTALVESGIPISEMTSLAALAVPADVKRMLRIMLERAGGGKSETVYNHAILLRTIARYWVKIPQDGVSEIDRLCKRLTVTTHGMTERNRARLRQFDEPANIRALLDLPSNLLRQAQKTDDGGSHPAMLVLYAAAVSILIACPIRIKNLTMLEIERHIVRQHAHGDSIMHLVIPGHEVKNGEPVERELPVETAALIELYATRYRPRLISGPSPFLFPHPNGRHRNPGSFSRRIADIILTETGLAMHVHLFRHAAVKFQLEAHPEDVETARRLLGHKSLQTTLRAYGELKSATAFKRYDDVIANLSKPSDAARKPPRKGLAA